RAQLSAAALRYYSPPFARVSSANDIARFSIKMALRHASMTPARALMRAAAIVRTAMTSAATTLSAGALTMALAAGCSWQSPATAPPSPPAAAGSPHVITNLSQLSSRDADVGSLNNAAKVLKSNPPRDETVSMRAQGPGENTSSALRRLFLEHPESPRYAETPIPHTQERLLDAKAAEYHGFANMMLTQLLNEIVQQEKTEPVVSLALPEEVKPVIVTAILSDKGQLKELIYEQHSGLAAVDNLVIAACKESLWANNMPKGALAKDGNYRLRIEAQLSKYSADREGKQTFITRLGLGIL
ncbi:MAG TPA: hypothetical protein VFE43_00145, partial [Candidatus Binataceae bacterium]|nr:hypothetical protein [Candidatus Binataceae bacterium]